MAASSDSAGSQTPVETTETTAHGNSEGRLLTPEQIRAMKNITEKIYAYRESEYDFHVDLGQTDIFQRL